MADEQPLHRNITSLLEGLPRAHLIEIARQMNISGIKAATKKFLNDQPLEGMLATMFPDFSKEKIFATAREIELCAMRNRCWSQMLSVPEEVVKVQMRSQNPRRAQALRERKGGVILAYWHIGANFMVALGMERIGVTGLILAQNPPPPWFRGTVSDNTRVSVISSDPSKAAVALKASVDRLRRGGIVAIAVDGKQGPTDLTVSFLGYKIPLRRGMAALARLTGAPIIPCAVTWGEKDWSLDFRIFEAVALPERASLPRDEWETQVIIETARRFEEIVRMYPGQIRLDRLAIFANAPRT